MDIEILKATMLASKSLKLSYWESDDVTTKDESF